MSNKSEAAKHVDLSARRFRRLVEDGILPRMPRAGYDLNEVRTTYIRYLREVAAGRGSKSGDVDLVAQRGALAAAQRERVELQNKITREEWTPNETMARMVEDICYAPVREKLLSMHGKLADFLVGKTREEIDQILYNEVCDMLTDFEKPYVLAMRAIELEKRK